MNTSARTTTTATRPRAQPRRAVLQRSTPSVSIRRRTRYLRSLSSAFILFASTATIPAKAAPVDDLHAVAALDTAFQAAVKLPNEETKPAGS